MAAVVRWIVVAFALALAGGAARAQGPCLADGPTRIADIELATGLSDPTHHAQWNGIDYFQAWDPLESTCRHASLSIL